ncbi:UDP-glucose 4-epimerase [Pullulanibacillus pueri]|uniref:UDP-glucose 4-epimerase n=1 Tax=Pullulanibacillus pueri TaxID=1437324 RepID=A0A8J3EM20_9BACL|nr:NAD-dependent epimerase/dehydratase family protein [Pullulanibacillus pueri]MBM7680949.1 UDP-glucose 4-epimerase [Pullulanibacillus pueri]GGH81454.1 UDP-glucose 4-epimerase [Pullulanibacillus pueri]
MKVLVTGGFGFIGSHIVDLLHESQHQVVVVDNLTTGVEENTSVPVSFYKKDITSPELEEVFKKEKPEAIIHLAAQINVSQSIQDPTHDAMINVLGTINLLTLAVKYNIKKFIFSSSCAIYGNNDQLPIKEEAPFRPFSIYGVSKYSSEQYIQVFHRLFGLPFTILRYANVYGPRQTSNGEGGVISIFIRKLLNKETIMVFGDGHQTRDFVFVEDVARANVLALETGDNQIINIGTKTQKKISEVVDMLSHYIPNNIAICYESARPGDIRDSCLDNEKARQVMGWAPSVSFDEGIKETINYYKSKNHL